MATFKDMQTSFKEGKTSACLCIATENRVPCTTNLTKGQKKKLTRLFDEAEHKLDVTHLRKIIFEVLCKRHQDSSHRTYEDQVEDRWREESPVKQLPDDDFDQRRSPSRRSSLSNPSTPTRQSRSKSPFFNKSPTLSPNDVRESPLHRRRSDSHPAEDSVFASIEPIPQGPSTPVQNGTTIGNTSQSEYSPAPDELLEVEGLDLEKGLVDHQWGDRSATVTGERSETRQYKVYLDENTDLQREPKQEPAAEHHLERTVESNPVDANDPFLENNSRPSLSPRSRKKSWKFEKSRTRSIGSRSPSTPPANERAKQAYATMAGDAMYDRKPRDNEANVVNIIHKPLDYNDKGRDGWIYALRDPELGLVKIGMTKQKPPKHAFPGDQRFQNFRAECQLSSVASMIEDADQAGIALFRRLEELVHEDLRPHRWYFDCNCGLNKSGRQPTEHHEWYDVSNEVALKTINLWRRFVMSNPYGELRNGDRHILEDKWLQRLNDRPLVAADEEHTHHEQRIQRWSTLLRLDLPQSSDKTLIPTSDLPTPEPETADLSQVKIEEDLNCSSLYKIPPAPDEPLAVPPLSDTKAFDILLNDNLHSFPTTPGTSTAAGTRSSSRDARGTLAGSGQSLANFPQALQDEIVEYPTNPPAVEAELTENADAPGIAVQDFATETFKLADSLGLLDTLLRKQRPGLPARSAYDDMCTFRWPLSTAVVLAMCSSYIPPPLSASFWLVFLPFFVAELREWHHEDGFQL